MVIYVYRRISVMSCHVRMTDIEGFLTIYGHSDNLLNNKMWYAVYLYILLIKCKILAVLFQVCWSYRYVKAV